MNRPVRKCVEKLESLELSAGTYPARRLPPRARYNRKDFYEYLSVLETLGVDEDLFELPYLEEDVG